MSEPYFVQCWTNQFDYTLLSKADFCDKKINLFGFESKDCDGRDCTEKDCYVIQCI